MPFALPPLAHRRGLLLAVVGLGLGVMGFALFAGRVAALRSGHATGPNWKFPSLVYSDDVVLVPGRILPAEYLLAQLEARDYHEVPGHPLGPGTFARLGETFEIALRGFSEAPDPLRNCDPETVRLRIQPDVRALHALGALIRGLRPVARREHEANVHWIECGSGCPAASAT